MLLAIVCLWGNPHMLKYLVFVPIMNRLFSCSSLFVIYHELNCISVRIWILDTLNTLLDTLLEPEYAIRYGNPNMLLDTLTGICY